MSGSVLPYSDRKRIRTPNPQSRNRKGIKSLFCNSFKINIFQRTIIRK
nr:MAG TPA: hypothetical protein [Caudoviricetes sp.]